jgi:hypothetical protein
MAGIYAEHRYRSGYLAVEVSGQTGKQVLAGCVVVEGRHRFESTEIRFSGWSYSDDMVELTAGSKCGGLSRTEPLESVDLRVAQKRPGQSGLMLKSVAQLSARMKFSNAILYAARGAGHQRQQFSSSVAFLFDNRATIHLTYLGKLRRSPTATEIETADHRLRLEGRFGADRWSLRCYIGYDAETDKRGHASGFGTLRYRTATKGLVEFWSNFGDLGTDGVNYWYLFVRTEWPMINQIRIAAKLANRYRRSASDVNRTQVSLELNAFL